MTIINWVSYTISSPENLNIEALREQAIELWGGLLFELNKLNTGELIFSFYPDSPISLLDVQSFVNSYDSSLTTDQLYQSFILDESIDADNQIKIDLSVFKQKSYLQIKTMIQNEIDGWTTLALARAGLRTWLPVILAALIFKAAKEIHR
jgi:hypothetical protein